MSTRTALRLAATIAIGLFVADAALWSQGRNGRRLSTVLIDGREAVEGEVLVRYRAEVGDLERERAEFQAETDEVEAVGRRGSRRMRSRRLGTRAMLQALRANPDVEYVEPNYVISVGATPNDPSFGNLWGLFNSGQTINGTAGVAGADIRATEAWNTTTGSRSVVVGVIDTGIDYTHPDLVANMWTAPRAFSVTIGGVAINCAAGTRGFNAITNTCNPMDDHYHGTHVAGTIGAVGNNGVGVAGVSQIASMMGLKFLNAGGSGTTADAIKSIEFAIQAKSALGADANVRILSNSWGGGGFSQSLKNQIDAANSAQMLFVAAAGNDNTNNDSIPQYPSNYTSSNIISVAATTNRDQRASFSNYGVSTVHLGAPGQAILSTMPGNTYSYLSGTSMATPHVSGAAALILSACPLTTAALKSTILTAVDPVAAMSGITSTGGRLNVRTALLNCSPNSPTLAINDVSVTEGHTGTVTATFTVTLNPVQSSQTVTVAYATANGTATANTDYASTSGTLTFTPGTTTRTISVAVNGDLTVEPNETFTVTLSGASNAIITDTQGVGTIVTDEAPPPPAMTLTSSVVLPGGTIGAQVTNGTGNPGDWIGVYSPGAADNAFSDWNYLNGTKSRPATGLTTATVQFPAPAVAGIYELRLFSVGYLKLATVSVGVGMAPLLTIDDASVTEGNSGTAAATFTVRLSVASPQTVTVAYATANGTATATTDYVAAGGTLTFSPGTLTRTISVVVNGDTTAEMNETFLVNLSGAANAAISDGQAVGTIVSDEAPPPPTMTLTSSVVLPGGTIEVQVTNGTGNAGDWIGFYAPGAADNGFSDWAYLNGTKSRPASGLTTATVQFPAPAVAGVYELRLFSVGYLKLATVSVGIGAAPLLTIDDASVTEGNSGTATATFTVRLSVASSQTATVAYATANGTATATTDYVAAGGTLTFSPGTLTRTISVVVNGDTTAEMNETFLVNLSGPVNAAISDGQGVGTIVSDEAPPAPSMTLTSSIVLPGGTIEAQVTNGTGNAGDWIGLYSPTAADNSFSDWIYLNGTKSRPATGLTAATIQLPAPTAAGGYELRLFSTGYLKLATVVVTVGSAPLLTIDDVSVVEGNSGTTVANFTTRLSAASTQTVTVAYATANGSATANTDYVAASGTLTFSPGTLTRTVSVVVNGDTTAEMNETFLVNLSGAASAAISDGQAVGTIVSDEAPPAATLSATSPVSPGAMIRLTVTGSAGIQWDWIGIYAGTSTDDRAFSDWNYLSGTKSAPAVGLTNATLAFPAPSTPGTYQLRLFTVGYARLATATVTVQ
jgi:subtilisin family serine protease